MHHHYHTIKQWARLLKEVLNGATLHSAFTLSKNRIRLCWKLQNNEWYNVEWQIAYQTCFTFTDHLEPHARPNAQALFNTIHHAQVVGVKQHTYNRSIEFEMSNGYQLVLKCYDGLSNILLFTQGKVVELFRKEIINDTQLILSDFEQKDEERIKAIQEIQYAENQFYITPTPNKKLPHTFSLQPIDQSSVLYTNLIDAYNHFARVNLFQLTFHHEKKQLLDASSKKINEIERKLQSLQIQLQDFRETIPPEHIGHIIMANLHLIKHGDSLVELTDFYTNKVISIKLKKELNPQQNAEWYYKKSKNRQRELLQLEEQQVQLNAVLPKLQAKHQQLIDAADLKQLKQYQSGKKEQQDSLPFRRFEIDGFTVLVGKGAANNDLLTLKYAHKNDIWLHAKDVSGSHVVIKQRSDKKYTTAVIDSAASIAAYYSKLRGSTWVPVAYTEKKFVRKPKGFDPGKVVVDKEEVILVAPRLPFSD
jgi:predicted ribosome quality control (RQC) complex YloA/Tae2 family protein